MELTDVLLILAALWVVVLVLIAVVATPIALGVRIVRRAQSRPCPNCGYSVRRGVLTCEECGFDVSTVGTSARGEFR